MADFFTSKLFSDIGKPLIGLTMKFLEAQKETIASINNETGGNCEELLQYYVQPNCQTSNPADDIFSVPNAPAFKTIGKFCEEYRPNGDGGECHMFILADAGMGKTSMLSILKLSHELASWKFNYGCELIKIGRDTLPRIEQLIAQPDYNAGNTVLLLDSLDEDPSCILGDTRSRLEELIRASKPFHRTLISCRTQFFPKGDAYFEKAARIQFGNFVSPMIYLSLFDDDQVEQYVNRRYPNELPQWQFWRERYQRRDRARTAVDTMKDFRFRPLLLSYLDEIMDCLGTDCSEYEVYGFVVDRWLGRESEKLLGLGIDLDQATLRLAATLIAEWMTINNQRTITLQAIGQIAEHTKRINEQQHKAIVSGFSKFDIGGRSLVNKTSEGEYRFSHLTIREYLFVEGLLNKSIPVTREGMLERPSDQQEIKPLRPLLSAVMLDFIPGAADFPIPLVIRDSFKDGGLGPEMVLIPAGEFDMGDSDGQGSEEEKPVHRVTISSFAMGCYAVTFDEYDYYCEAMSIDKPDDSGWGRGRRPVIHLSWEDAQLYCQWLSEQTGQVYRLPTEAEREYACRAGTTTAYSTGEDIDFRQANFYHAQAQAQTQTQTKPVGSYQANLWGLYDMHGNVWEWVVDCWHANYQGAPINGRTWGGPSGRRVLRGGCWDDYGTDCRSASRLYLGPDGCSHYVGLRLARGPMAQ